MNEEHLNIDMIIKKMQDVSEEIGKQQIVTLVKACAAEGNNKHKNDVLQFDLSKNYNNSQLSIHSQGHQRQVRDSALGSQVHTRRAEGRGLDMTERLQRVGPLLLADEEAEAHQRLDPEEAPVRPNHRPELLLQAQGENQATVKPLLCIDRITNKEFFVKK